MRALGIDLGGSSIKAALVETAAPGHVVAGSSAPTGAGDGAEAVLDRMAALARETVVEAGPVDAVGVAAPGPLDLERGRSLSMPNLPGWEDVPIVAELERRLERPIHLINDGRAFALAELRLGAGRGCRDLVCLALGTGIGGGVVVANRLLLGLNGTVGELGHQTVDADGPDCPCGSRGCLEQFASGPAIARAAGAPSAEAALESAKAGDETALVAFERAGAYLGIGIANAVLAAGPERVVVGGGVAAAGELLLGPARAELARRVRVMPVERIAVVRGELGPVAGAAGAALWGTGDARVRT